MSTAPVYSSTTIPPPTSWTTRSMVSTFWSHIDTASDGSGKSELSAVWTRIFMYGVVIVFGSGWRPDWIPMTNAEMTADSRPACGTPGRMFSTRVWNRAAYKKKRRVQIVVVRSNIHLPRRTPQIPSDIRRRSRCEDSLLSAVRRIL